MAREKQQPPPPPPPRRRVVRRGHARSRVRSTDDVLRWGRLLIRVVEVDRWAGVRRIVTTLVHQPSAVFKAAVGALDWSRVSTRRALRALLKEDWDALLVPNATASNALRSLLALLLRVRAVRGGRDVRRAVAAAVLPLGPDIGRADALVCPSHPLHTFLEQLFSADAVQQLRSIPTFRLALAGAPGPGMIPGTASASRPGHAAPASFLACPMCAPLLDEHAASAVPGVTAMPVTEHALIALHVSQRRAMRRVSWAHVELPGVKRDGLWRLHILFLAEDAPHAVTSECTSARFALVYHAAHDLLATPRIPPDVLPALFVIAADFLRRWGLAGAPPSLRNTVLAMSSLGPRHLASLRDPSSVLDPVANLLAAAVYAAPVPASQKQPLDALIALLQRHQRACLRAVSMARVRRHPETTLLAAIQYGLLGLRHRPDDSTRLMQRVLGLWNGLRTLPLPHLVLIYAPLRRAARIGIALAAVRATCQHVLGVADDASLPARAVATAALSALETPGSKALAPVFSSAVSRHVDPTAVALISVLCRAGPSSLVLKTLAQDIIDPGRINVDRHMLRWAPAVMLPAFAHSMVHRLDKDPDSSADAVLHELQSAVTSLAKHSPRLHPWRARVLHALSPLLAAVLETHRYGEPVLRILAVMHASVDLTQPPFVTLLQQAVRRLRDPSWPAHLLASQSPVTMFALALVQHAADVMPRHIIIHSVMPVLLDTLRSSSPAVLPGVHRAIACIVQAHADLAADIVAAYCEPAIASWPARSRPQDLSLAIAQLVRALPASSPALAGLLNLLQQEVHRRERAPGAGMTQLRLLLFRLLAYIDLDALPSLQTMIQDLVYPPGAPAQGSKRQPRTVLFQLRALQSIAMSCYDDTRKSRIVAWYLDQLAISGFSGRDAVQIVTTGAGAISNSSP